MDKDKLIKKREELKNKLELESRLSLISDLTEHLESKNINYNITYDDVATEWISNTFPALFSSLDWDKISGSKKLVYSTYEERDKIISEAISNSLESSDIVIVAWSNGLRPEVEVSAGTIIKHASIFADEDFDFWVTNIEKGFCLENYHEGYVGWSIQQYKLDNETRGLVNQTVIHTKNESKKKY